MHLLYTIQDKAFDVNCTKFVCLMSTYEAHNRRDIDGHVKFLRHACAKFLFQQSWLK